MKIKNSCKVFNCVVIGLGPAGICAALKLKETKTKTLLLDQKDYIGGMAFTTDVNLQGINGFPPKNDFGKKVIGSQLLANQRIKEIYNTFNSYGLLYCQVHLDLEKFSKSGRIKSNGDFGDIYSYPVNKDILGKMTKNIFKDLQNSSNLTIKLKSKVKNVVRGSIKNWRIYFLNNVKEEYIETDSLILATGKLSATWLYNLYNNLKIKNKINNKICIGVRVEEQAKNLNQVLIGQHNPKIKIIKNGIISETFCWCKNGKVFSYQFCGGQILDGEHCYSNPNMNSNFGIIVSIDLPKKVSSLKFSIAFMNYLNSLGINKILIQKLGDFRNNLITQLADIKSNCIKPSLKKTSVANIREYFPERVNSGILSLIDKINMLYPGSITDNALIYAPMIEGIFPVTQLTKNMETNLRGIFIIGDCAGKSIGVVPSCIMGSIAAESIAKKYKNS